MKWYTIIHLISNQNFLRVHSAIALTDNSRPNLDYFWTCLYSVILTEYVRMDLDCLCVRVCVTALQPKRLGWFWSNFTQVVSRTWASVVFLRFWISQFDDVMAAILSFSYAALSRSLFRSDFVQIWICCSQRQPGYPVFAIGNQPNRSVTLEPHVQLSRFSPQIAAKNHIFGYRQASSRFQQILTCLIRSWKYFFPVGKVTRPTDLVGKISKKGRDH